MQIESFFQIKTSVANPKYMTNALEKKREYDRQGDILVLHICRTIKNNKIEIVNDIYSMNKRICNRLQA
jgi:hypothetical protein